jgi:hypothetical protein
MNAHLGLPILSMLLCVSLAGNAAEKKTKHYTTFYRGAVVFRDANANGNLDQDEPPFVTGDDGGFDAPSGKGRFVLKEGTDINSGAPNPYKLLSSPPKTGGVGTITSLWQALLDRGEKVKTIKKNLGFPLNFTLKKYKAVSFDKPLDLDQDLTARKEIKANVLGEFVRALAGASYGIRYRAPTGMIEDRAIGAIARSLLDMGTGIFDRNDKVAVQSLLDASLKRLDAVASPDLLSAAAASASDIGALIADAPQDKLQVLTRVVVEASALAENRDSETLQAEYTGDALREKVEVGSTALEPFSVGTTCKNILEN